MRKMEHIMESVVVRVADVVRKRFTDEYIIPLQITLLAFSLRNFNLEVLGKLFFNREFVVEKWQL